MNLPRNPTRSVRVGNAVLGDFEPIVVQSMTATHTRNIDATVEQIESLVAAGAGIVRIAVDSRRDIEAVAEIRRQTTANLAVDLQENYRLAQQVAPHVDKIRYNPGHLYHHEPNKPWQQKVQYLAQIAADHDCALRVGVNAGSIDPDERQRAADDRVAAMVNCARRHCEQLDSIGFLRYCVSLKNSDPDKVIRANQLFAAERPDVPLHLGVTEAGMPPDGVIKTRIAFEQLLSRGMGDTIRVSLTLPNDRKAEEVTAGLQMLQDIADGRVRSVVKLDEGLNIISCPSCSRVENEAFVDLAHRVKELTAYARHWSVTIAVMGCRVNGPGETDDADIGLWCGPQYVNLKRKSRLVGAFPYDTVLEHLQRELDELIAVQAAQDTQP